MSELRGNFCPPKQEKELFLPLNQTGAQILGVHHLGCEGYALNQKDLGVYGSILDAQTAPKVTLVMLF